jgi:hypothetical protein
MVLREAPARFYLIVREHLHPVSHIFSFGATCTQLIGLTTIPSLLMTQIYATAISSLDTDSLFWVCDNSAPVKTAMTSLFSLENLFLQFISLVQQQALPNQR